jgi:predicted transposase/invertase (TIGR01784 family)
VAISERIGQDWQKGLEKGLEKGIQKGIQVGKLETARNLQAEGFELSLIKKITGLTEEEIKGAGI